MEWKEGMEGRKKYGWDGNYDFSILTRRKRNIKKYISRGHAHLHKNEDTMQRNI